MSANSSCTAVTTAGEACRARPVGITGVCLAHTPGAREEYGFGGAQPGAGRPATPTALMILRERVEADIERWLQPFEDALEHEDVEIRMRAASQVLDRVYGKPRQS